MIRTALSMASLVAAFGALTQAQSAQGETRQLVIAATTDVHGRLRGWDYYKDAPDASGGLARAATIVDSLRRAAPGGLVLVDAGDMLQGNPLAFIASKRSVGVGHPVIAAMNAMRYDAATIGNHEFDYGLGALRRAIGEAHFPLLAANAVARGGAIAFTASRLVTRQGVRVGIVGATTPGTMVWAADQVRERVTIGDILSAVRRNVTALKRRSADVVVVVLHSGLNDTVLSDSSAGARPQENVAARVAREVPGIDVVVFGHSHRELVDSVIGSTLLMQPRDHAGSVAVARLSLERTDAGWRVTARNGRAVPTAGWSESPAVLAATERGHRAALAYVKQPIGTTATAWPADSARVVDTPLTDFILEVERLAAGADLASSAAFSLDASLAPGPITVGEVSRLYPYDNTLKAVRISGRQLRQYLEFSARYFRTWTSGVGGGAPAIDPTVAGYNYDIVSGAEYTLDLSRPVGQRVTRLEFHGKPVADNDTFTLALSNYRQAGGGGYDMFRGAPVVYDRGQDIRELLIEEVVKRGSLQPSEYYTPNWRIEPAAAVGTAYREMHRLPLTGATQGGGRRLRIITTNDFHGALEPRRDSSGTNRGGAAWVAARIAEARRECVAPACVSLWLDGGDLFQGTPASNFAFGRPVVELFNSLGLVASALGNHEFDWGQDTLRARMREAHFPILGANVTYADGSDVPWIPDDTIVVAGGLRVGIIGIADVATPRTTRASLVSDLRFGDPAPVIDAHARTLRARGAEVVVVVAHMGAFCTRRGAEAPRCDGEVLEVARRLTERVDVIVSGHTHSAVMTTVNGIPVVQARTRGTAIGIVDIPIGGGESTIVLRDVIAGEGIPDSAVDSLVHRVTSVLRERMARPIAPIDERMELGIGRPLGDLIADAQRAAGHADVALMNSGGVRAPLDTGMATFGALFEVQPFANVLMKVTLRGRDLRSYLERLVSHNRLTAHLSGVRVRYDPARPPGSRLLDVRLFDGTALDDERTYTMVLSDFLLGGGDGLGVTERAIMVEELGVVDLDALIDYLRAQPAPVRAPRDPRLIPVTP